MAQIYGPTNPPEVDSIDSFTFKRWFGSLTDLFKSQMSLVTQATTYTVAANIYYVRGDATAGGFTVTLPPALNNQGRKILLKKIDSSGNAVTVSKAGSDTIEGSNTVSLGSQWDKLHVISNGVNAWEKL